MTVGTQAVVGPGSDPFPPGVECSLQTMKGTQSTWLAVFVLGSE